MKIIVRPRQCGKTTELLEYAATYGYTIMTISHRECERLKRVAKEMDLNIEEPLSVQEYPDCVCSKSFRGIVIDNADMVLRHFLRDVLPSCNANLAMITMCGVPDHEYDKYKCIEQWEQFRVFNPELTYLEFCNFKYGLKLEE